MLFKYKQNRYNFAFIQFRMNFLICFGFLRAPLHFFSTLWNKSTCFVILIKTEVISLK